MGFTERLDPPDRRNPVCPVCGWECETVAKNLNGEVIGCDNCLDIEDAYFWEEENDEH